MTSVHLLGKAFFYIPLILHHLGNFFFLLTLTSKKEIKKKKT